MLQISWKMRGSNSKKCQLRAPNWCKLQGKWTEQQIQQKIPKRKNNNSQNNSWPLPYTFIHVHTHPYISIHIHIYNLYIYIDPQISMHIHRYPYIHTSIPPYIHGCMHACMHKAGIYIYVCIQTPTTLCALEITAETKFVPRFVRHFGRDGGRSERNWQDEMMHQARTLSHFCGYFVTWIYLVKEWKSIWIQSFRTIAICWFCYSCDCFDLWLLKVDSHSGNLNWLSHASVENT